MLAKEALPDGFYSGEPRERVAALADATEEIREALLNRVPEWPVMSPGALNAWLVLIGPSPGNSPGGAWTYDPRPSIRRAHPGVAEYVDGRGFWNGVREYARAVFPELGDLDAYSATMVRNLDPVQSATAPKGPRMRIAARQVVEVLGEIIRPRLVIAIGGSRQYADPAFKALSNVRERRTGILYTSLSREERPWFSLVGSWKSGDPFLYVSPSGIHPSLRHVSREDSMVFLCKKSEEARTLHHRHSD